MIQSLRGMRDILPNESARWQTLESKVHAVMARFDFAEIRTPIAESTELFVRGIGEDTDVVSKEMYSFDDRSGDSITLRPENTAGVVRAASQHNLVGRGATEKLYYMGPMFRYERPQRGRYRQFHQIGAEVLGIAGPYADFEIIALARRLFDELGLLPHLKLEINTLGQPEERKSHRDALLVYFEENRQHLDEDSLARLKRGNPLRILDSKNPALQSLIESAPKLLDYLGEASAAHFASVQNMLDALGQDYTVNPRLVRGLDYYWHTVFEWTTELLGAQSTVCGGGRYDGLSQSFNGKDIPCTGWGLGMERLLEVAAAVGALSVEQKPDLYLVAAGGGAMTHAAIIADRLRAVIPELKLATACEDLSFKAQFKRADKSGAKAALVLGQNEVTQQTIGIKWLRGQGEEEIIPQESLVAWVKTHLFA